MFHTAPETVEGLSAAFITDDSQFNSMSQLWAISINISWSQTLYNVTVYRTDNSADVVYSNDALTDTSVTPSVMVPAFTNYTVTVAASTSAGQGEAVSLTIQSPQAGTCYCALHTYVSQCNSLVINTYLHFLLYYYNSSKWCARSYSFIWSK